MSRNNLVNPKVSRISDSVLKLGPLGNPKVLCSYLLLGPKPAIVDCGPRVVIDELLELVNSCGIDKSEISSLLLTHIHIDHAGGAAELLTRCHNAAAYIPKRGLRHMLNPGLLNSSARQVLGGEIMDYWGDCSPVPEHRAISVEENQVIDLPEHSIKYIPARGHAPHHNVLLDQSKNILFAADGLGIFEETRGVNTPTTPPPSLDLEQALQDIDMIQDLETKLLCLAHFREVSPSSSFFNRVRAVYAEWANLVRAYVTDSPKINFEEQDYASLFQKLESSHPEYTELPSFLRKQIIRTDIGGLVDYFRRKKSEHQSS